VIPALQGREHGEVVRFQKIHARRKDIRKLAFIDENRCLPFANGQLGTVFDFIAIALKAPNHCIAVIACPFDDIDKFTRQPIPKAHLFSSQLGAAITARDQLSRNLLNQRRCFPPRHPDTQPGIVEDTQEVFIMTRQFNELLIIIEN